MTGSILVNPSAGDPATGLDALREAFADHDVVECAPDRLDLLFADLIADHDGTFIGMAGGDGSMRAAAAHLRGTSIPLLVIPAGTRNHLAGDLGIDSVDAAIGAADAGVVQLIDLGDANGETFVNNLSVGTYPEMVTAREHHQHRFPKPIANVIAAAGQLLRGRRTRIAVDGREHRAWAVFIGNGRYGTSIADLVARDALDDGLLDVRVVRADRRFARLRVTVSMLFGRLDRSPLVIESTASTVRLDSRRSTLEVALDGEVMQLSTPIDVRSVPRALAVLVPADDPRHDEG